MQVDSNHPANHPALNFFSVTDWGNVEIHRLADIPAEHIREAYWECGSHPEIVERVWDALGAELNDNCCLLVHGVNCIVHDQSGVLLAVSMGTQYVVRVTDADLPAAIDAGLKRTCDWGGTDHTNLETEFGPNWLFGGWDATELIWIRNVYSQFSSA